MVPTYLFIGCLLGAIGLGLVKALLSGGHPAPVIPPIHSTPEARPSELG